MHYRLILASNSPRRRALLARVMPQHRFTVIASRIKERILPGELPEKFAMRMAEKKARTVLMRHKVEAKRHSAIIGADTVVVLGKKVLQQPKSRAEARKMLQMLSGKRHVVMTGVCFLFLSSDRIEGFVVKSKVWFKTLSESFINAYVHSGESMDKAGAYAIQGRGRSLIRKYQGSFTNIVGLPIKEIRDFLKDRKRLST